MTESDQYEKNFEWSRFWKENLERKWDKDAYVKWLVELQKEYNEDAEKDDGGDAEKANQEPKEQKKYYHLPEVGDIKKLVGGASKLWQRTNDRLDISELSKRPSIWSLPRGMGGGHNSSLWGLTYSTKQTFDVFHTSRDVRHGHTVPCLGN